MEEKKDLVQVYNTYKVFYGSRVVEEEPVLHFFIKPFTVKLILPAIIGEYKVFGLDFFGIKKFLGKSDKMGIFDFPEKLVSINSSTEILKLGISKPNDMNIYSVEIIPENNSWKSWVKKMFEKGFSVDNFKYENDGTIYVYAYAVQKNAILQNDHSVVFALDY